jgi:hypothetical protein
MDLQDAHASVTSLIRDRDSNYTAAVDAVVADSGITTITTGIRIPRMNAIIKRWIRTCRTELLDRTLILNQAHLLHAPCANSKRVTTTTEPTAPCMPQLPFAHSPHRSPKQRNSTSSPSDSEIDSAASFTNTTMPPNSTDENFGTYNVPRRPNAAALRALARNTCFGGDHCHSLRHGCRGRRDHFAG